MTNGQLCGIVVHEPDGRGLRRVSVGGVTIGWAWSVRDLRRVLRKAGAPRDFDLDDPSRVEWAARADLWPDDRWGRRAKGGLAGLGLLVCAFVLFTVGLTDALRALTFVGRVLGFVFIVGALLELLAAAAVVDYWGKRRVKYASRCVLLGVVIAAVVSLMLLALGWDSGYYRDWFWFWITLAVWSIWALWELSRLRAWREVPHPKSFAVSLVVSALVGATSIAHSSVYKPYVAPPKVSFKAVFGKPSENIAHGSLYVPIDLTFRNEGSISVFTVGTIWTASLYPSTFSGKGIDFDDWKSELGDGYDSYSHESFQSESRALAAGQITTPGARLDPGDDFSKTVVIEVPAKGIEGRVEIAAAISHIRADRCKLGNKYSSSVQYSWDVGNSALRYTEKRPDWLLQSGDEFFRYQARIYQSSLIMSLTQPPDWVSMWWVIPHQKTERTPYMSVHIARDLEGRQRLSDAEQEPYGMKTVSLVADLPVALLRSTAQNP
ncbi:hypothetical protein AB0D29_36715 [Streptomyces sp. NPDC048424]|uniref:hypothetical protein n=1 Tax=Streptomyces sp. NPDC048424 TaxID=3155265 RepID=UPI00342F1E0A